MSSHVCLGCVFNKINPHSRPSYLFRDHPEVFYVSMFNFWILPDYLFYRDINFIRSHFAVVKGQKYVRRHTGAAILSHCVGEF